MIGYPDMGIALTAWRRPGYTRRALESWTSVPEIWDLAVFRMNLDPSDRQDEMLNVAKAYPFVQSRVNAEHRGVSGNPADSMTDLFRRDDVQFGIIADDDMIVSDDILRYFQWAATMFEYDHEVAAVCAHTPEPAPADADPEGVQLLPRYRCWIWGTWREPWFSLLEPTWDRDYSSGEPAGYDWNLDLRVIPGSSKVCVFPLASRSQNIGRFEGVHASPGEFQATVNPSFQQVRGEVAYRMVP